MRSRFTTTVTRLLGTQAWGSRGLRMSSPTRRPADELHFNRPITLSRVYSRLVSMPTMVDTLNWARNQPLRFARAHHPTSVAEVAAIVTAATHVKVRDCTMACMERATVESDDGEDSARWVMAYYLAYCWMQRYTVCLAHSQLTPHVTPLHVSCAGRRNGTFFQRVRRGGYAGPGSHNGRRLLGRAGGSSAASDRGRRGDGVRLRRLNVRGTFRVPCRHAVRGTQRGVAPAHLGGGLRRNRDARIRCAQRIPSYKRRARRAGNAKRRDPAHRTRRP